MVFNHGAILFFLHILKIKDIGVRAGMNSEIMVINAAESEDRLPYPFMRKYFSCKQYRKKVLKKMPLREEKGEYIGEKVKYVQLPFTKEQLTSCDALYKKIYMEKLLEETGEHSIYMEPELRKLFNFSMEERTWLLKYILFPQCYRKIIEEFSLDEKSLRPIIFDSCDRKIVYLLKQIKDNLNYLTILTERKEYFNDFREMLYSTAGLAVDFISPGENTPIEGNLIIDTNSEYFKEYGRIDDTAVILDMETKKEKLRYLYARKKKRTVIYDIEAEREGILLNNELTGEILYSMERDLREFYKGFRFMDEENINRYAPEYQIQLRGLKVL